jgi:peptidoglycan/LPS O-acetylase OafA/YrhL
LPSSGLQTRTEFRPEVEGLRATAVLMVVIYHVWLGRVSGGVDVFLLISAFLLTLSATRRVEKGLSPGIIGRWARVFSRLLPPAAVVLLATITASFAFFPQVRWAELIDHAWASLLYVQNWELARGSVAYQAAGAGVSPFQHFWSLSIQGQVFIAWPLLLAGCAATARASRASFRLVAIPVFGSVFIVSLAFSIAETAHNQSFAYFDTRARLWEFALGSLLALCLPWLRPGRGLRILMGWVGLASIALCGVVIQVSDAFPGYAALLPTLGAALVIAAGGTASRWAVDRPLSSPIARRLGKISYTLYLWHWPILVTYLLVTGAPSASFGAGTAIIAASLMLASATTRLVDRPISSWKWVHQRRRRKTAFTAVLALGVAMPLTGWESRITAAERDLHAQPEQLNPGAAALAPDYQEPVPEADPIPAVTSLDQEWADAGPICSPAWEPEDPALERCHQIEPETTVAKTIIVIGDSHAQQWMAAIGPIAMENGWRVIALLKNACRYGGDSSERDAECNDFNAAARDYALERQPDAVLTLGTISYTDEPRESLVPAYQAGIEPFLKRGIEVISIRDNPRFPFNMFECAQFHGHNAPRCNPALADVLLPENPAEQISREEPLFHSVDMTDRICTATTCPPLVGNVYVYRDFDHLNKTYVQTMIPALEQRILQSTGWNLPTQ